MKIKCSRCLKLVAEKESDHCETCDKSFCVECLTCLTYYGEKSELAFCSQCEAK